MTKKGFLGVLGLWAWTLASAGAQTVSLDQAVEEALSRGADQAIWAANLSASRAVEAAARARAGLTVSPSLAYGATETWSQPSKTSDELVGHSATAGVTVATPLTSLAFEGTRSLTAGPSGISVSADKGTATVRQVLWNGYPGGTTQATVEKAALTLKIAEWNAQTNRNKLVLAVKQAYFTLLSAQESLNQLTQAQKQRQETVRFVQTKFDLGQATALDLKQARINALTADLDLEAGKSALDAARRRLANQLGRADDSLLEAASEPDPGVTVATKDQAVAAALAQRPEPLIAQANLRAAQIDADLVFGASIPSVTLTGGVTYSKDAVKDTGSVVGTLGLSLGGPLVDGGLSAAQKAQAEAQKTTALMQYQQSLKTIPVDVAEAWNTWQINQGRHEVAALALEVAQGQRQVVQAQYDAGLKNLTDLQTSDVALSSAQLALLKAKITAQLSALALQSLMGQ